MTDDQLDAIEERWMLPVGVYDGDVAALIVEVRRLRKVNKELRKRNDEIWKEWQTAR